MFEEIRLKIAEMESIKKELQKEYLDSKIEAVKDVIALRNMQLSIDLAFLKGLLKYEQIK